MQLPVFRRACLLSFLALPAFTGACSPAPEAAPRASPEASSDSAAPASRIVPASATAVDFVAALVGPERIAGFPEQALEYSSLHDDERFADHPGFYAFLAEPVLRLGPDLVISDPWQARDTQERLREAGVPVIALPEISSYEDARGVLLQLGEVLDVRQRAAQLVAELDERVAVLARRTEGRNGRRLRAMSYSNFGSAGFTAGAHTTVDEMMKLAGLENLMATAGREGHAQVTFEELLAFDPDLILVSEPLKQAAGHAGDRGGASAELLRSEVSLVHLRAVREDRIISLPAWLFATASHELVGSAEALADELDLLLIRLDEASAPR